MLENPPLLQTVRNQKAQIELLQERLQNQGRQATEDAMEFHRTIRLLKGRIKELEVELELEKKRCA